MIETLIFLMSIIPRCGVFSYLFIFVD